MDQIGRTERIRRIEQIDGYIDVRIFPTFIREWIAANKNAVNLLLAKGVKPTQIIGAYNEALGLALKRQDILDRNNIKIEADEVAALLGITLGSSYLDS